jgi:hypothetical protein
MTRTLKQIDQDIHDAFAKAQPKLAAGITALLKQGLTHEQIAERIKANLVKRNIDPDAAGKNTLTVIHAYIRVEVSNQKEG